MNPHKLIFVTGASGFIGFHLSKKLLSQGHRVVGFDNINDYYEVSLKEARIAILQKEVGFTFVKGDLHHRETKKIFAVGFAPKSIEAGVSNFIDWYMDYYKINK